WRDDRRLAVENLRPTGRPFIFACRYRAVGLVSRPVRSADVRGSLPLFRIRLDHALLRRAVVSFHLLRLWLDSSVAGKRNADPFSVAGPARGLCRDRFFLSRSRGAALPRLHLCLPARSGPLPESFLPRLSLRRPCGFCARASGVFRGCVATAD